MAYLRECTHRCNYSGCTSQAKEELLTWRNELYGRYCGKHSKSMLRQALAEEQRHFAQQAKQQGLH